MPKKWEGTKPEKCQICRGPLLISFVDGKTRRGPWMIMCIWCHKRFGVGLGIGRGQLYDIQTLYKEAG